jgi:hypothetical protein
MVVALTLRPKTHWLKLLSSWELEEGVWRDAVYVDGGGTVNQWQTTDGSAASPHRSVGRPVTVSQPDRFWLATV